ncbi:hypothetical protein PV416_43530 [Streptomyces ipomoeae]|uniref:hypothetical protein n=1 Tax=Streptomyces ipomoeae TaxID=103232 RepID=UPI0011473E73|nr:hypothetical protein [Streptomyces ipomoeae]MDX2827749.1 hypothetical protein [Streptomyces ipomoeae]MDX2873104.1 hypothetical protein [Streptomyces ipomoeae]TQE25366.1 hypothetical protein Sipo7851_34760 [Streptomyces ipomoeae]
MTIIDVLHETRGHASLAEEIEQILRDTASLIQEVTDLPCPSLVFRLLPPRAWRAEIRAWAERSLEEHLVKAHIAGPEADQARGRLATWAATALRLGWPMTPGLTITDHYGEPRTLITSQALHHTGIRYDRTALIRYVVHAAVHHAQIMASAGALPPPPIRADAQVHDDSATRALMEGHAAWAEQEVAGAFFGFCREHRPREVPRSWRYRQHARLLPWLQPPSDLTALACGRAADSSGPALSDGVGFIQAAIEVAGSVVPFNRIWTDPSLAPTCREITNPEAWFSRVSIEGPELPQPRPHWGVTAPAPLAGPGCPMPAPGESTTDSSPS